MKPEEYINSKDLPENVMVKHRVGGIYIEYSLKHLLQEYFETKLESLKVKQ